ncbi:hypothetical protein PIB30_083556 [Stylosanthes scabra]|uniref:Uncharacterized protein n=1 Tax=Stylosanthes scabra TaxID=79078 RepID=A0ABU6TUJ4_9FABA|nr:hypothetical protein [Stylosanthes scabra]
MKGKSRKTGIRWEPRAFLTRYTRVNERKHDRFDLFGHEDMPMFKCGEVDKAHFDGGSGFNRQSSERKWLKRARGTRRSQRNPKRQNLDPVRTHQWVSASINEEPSPFQWEPKSPFL